MGYATVDDFTNAFDEQTIRDLASDTGIAVESLATSTAVTSALDAGAGRIEAACFVGKMYSVDDLVALTGHSAALLARMNCEIALMYLMSRRPEKYGTDFFKAIDERIESYLQELREGARLFVTENAQDAGLPTVDGPTSIVCERLNLITQRTQRFYPSVASRLPVGRGG
jgi:phage gp36-like protein